jgi:hypothetical protein
MLSVHPEMNLQIAQLRVVERSGRRRRFDELDAVRHTGIRGFFRRRRDLRPADERPSTTVVLLPPPREERAPGGHDQRVA